MAHLFMVVEKNFDEFDEEEDVKPKISKSQKAKPAIPLKNMAKNESNLFGLLIVVVVILAIIGIVFGYTKSKLNQLDKGGNEANKGLESQLSDLQNQLGSLKDKAEKLEKENSTSKNVVFDLFNKDRKLPRTINVEGWNILKQDDLSFSVLYPTNWEVVKPVMGAINAPAAVDGNPAEEVKQNDSETVYLQPIGQADFINAITIKADYDDFAKLSIKEKSKIFEDLDALDEYTFDQGKMIYFINPGKDGEQIPTVLVLTADKIYRASFNITDNTSMEYFKFRQDFEIMMVTFDLNKIVDKTETATQE